MDEKQKPWYEKAKKLDGLELCDFDTVNETAIYINSFSDLERITYDVPWRIVKGFEGHDVQVITLGEIREYVAKEYEDALVTVFDCGPLKTTIYQCNNYGHGLWEKLGEIQGYW